jgi:hypothetical protein
MDGYTGIVSFVLSSITALATFYLWAVKARQEQPRLRVCKAEPRFGGYSPSSCGDPVRLVFEVKAVVANYSSLPNALLGVRTWLRLRDGSWREAEARIDERTALPLNLPAMQTSRLNLTATLAVPALAQGQSCRNTHETFALYSGHYLAQPVAVKLELTALGDRAFTDVLSSPRAAA